MKKILSVLLFTVGFSLFAQTGNLERIGLSKEFTNADADRIFSSIGAQKIAKDVYALRIYDCGLDEMRWMLGERDQDVILIIVADIELTRDYYTTEYGAADVSTYVEYRAGVYHPVLIWFLDDTTLTIQLAEKERSTIVRALAPADWKVHTEEEADAQP